MPSTHLIVVSTHSKANETSKRLQKALTERGISFSTFNELKIIDAELNTFLIRVVPVIVETPLIKGFQVDSLDVQDLEQVFLEKMYTLRSDVRKRSTDGEQDMLPALVEFNF